MSETFTPARTHGALLLTLLKCMIYTIMVHAYSKDEQFFTHRRCLLSYINTFYGCQTVLSHPNLLCYNLNANAECYVQQ